MNASPRDVERFCLFILIASMAGGVLIVDPWRASAKPQQQDKPLQYDVRVINIEVPVRVFSGDSFVDSLKLEDFEVYEDGVLQNLEAAYLVKTTSISRKEENQAFNPETSRAFYLFFVLYDYDPRIREALAFFVSNVLHPGDRLFVVTPHATYRMRAETLAAAPKERIADQLTGIIRKDILTENLGYRNTLSNLFLYLTTVPTDIARAQMEERSWDVYQSFSEMARATGGLISSASNSVALMEKASSASENYYLLYYSPKDKTRDGKFREIKVKVKTGGYRVAHLAGYFAK